MSKKDQILSAAKDLFNREGFASVNMHELAQKMDMSRGNLTYHFKTKDLLLEAIAQEMWSKLEVEKNKSRQLPSFQNLHNEVQLLMRFQKEYQFIFQDNHVLNHPLIKAQFRTMTEQTLKDNKAAIAFSIELGNMKAEPFSGAYNNIAFLTWMVSFYWKSQEQISVSDKKQDPEKIIWSLLIPHFTEKGVNSFIEFFGKEYYENLGEAFNVDLSTLIKI